MATTLVVYTYFNQTQMVGVLNAVAAVIGTSHVDGAYLGILKSLAMVGLFVAVCYGFLRARGEDAAQYLIVLAIFYTALLVPKISVWVEDDSGIGGGPIKVDNVPLGLAFFASVTSHIGYWLTSRTELMFALPDTQLQLEYSGILGGARALRAVQGATLQDPGLAQDMINFMRDCINPEMAADPTKMQAVMSSRDLWADFSNQGLVNPGRMVSLTTSTTGSTQCDTAYTTIGNSLNSQATSEFGRIAQWLMPNATASAANTMLASLLPAAEGLIMTASASTTDAIKQRMMINVLNDTGKTIGQITNDPAAVNAAQGEAMAESSAMNSYRVMARMAQETLPLMRNALELVIIGVFPFVSLLIIVAGAKGGVVLRSYVMSLMWVELWPPLYAIVNYVATLQTATSMKASLGGVDGVTIANAAALADTGMSAEAVVGSLIVSVPMMAYALIKAGESAMSGVAASALGTATSAGGSIGGQVGVGNINMGNTSWGNESYNNKSGNKSDLSYGHVDSDRGDIKGQWGSHTVRGGAKGTDNAVGNFNAELGNIGVTGSHGAGVEAGHADSSGRRADSAQSSRADLAKGAQGGYTESQRASFSRALATELSNTTGSDWSFLTRDGASQSHGTGNTAKVTTGNGHSEQIATRGAASVDAQVGESASNPGAGGGTSAVGKIADVASKLPGFGKFGVGGSMSLMTNDTEDKRWSGERGVSADERKQLEQGFDMVKKAAQAVQGRTSDAGQKAAADDFIGQLSRSLNATYGTSTSSTLTDTASSSDSRSDKATASFSVSDNDRYAQEGLRRAGGRPDDLLKRAATDGQFRDEVGRSVAGGVAAATAPPGGAASGMAGAPIQAPKSVEAQKGQGDAAVQAERPKNEAAATSVGKAGEAQAVAKRDPGVADAKGGPSLQSATDGYNAVRSETTGGHGGLLGKQQMEAGARVATEAIFADRTGMMRLLQTSTGLKGETSQRPDKTERLLKQLGKSDPEAAKILGDIANTHHASKDQIKDLLGRVETMAENKKGAAAGGGGGGSDTPLTGP